MPQRSVVRPAVPGKLVFAPLMNNKRPPMASIGGLFGIKMSLSKHTSPAERIGNPYDGYSNGLFYKTYFSYVILRLHWMRTRILEGG